MAVLSAEQLAGPGYIILNVMRALNIVTLASVVASSVVMLVKTFIVSKFFFFDATSHVVTGFVGMFLIVSECSLFRNYFARNWPLLSPSHGFVSLGLAMMILGLNMLGNMNKEATSQESLSLPFWRLLVASGILAIVIGFFNVIASYVFSDRSRHMTARRVRAKGAIALTEIPEDDFESCKKAYSINTHHTGSNNSRSGTPRIDIGSPQEVTSPTKESRFSHFNFSSPIRTLRNARQSILPSYHSSSPLRNLGHSRASSTYSRSTSGESRWKKGSRDSEVPEMPLKISAPLNVNPQFAHLVKPNLAHHPSVRRGETNDAGLKEFKF